MNLFDAVIGGDIEEVKYLLDKFGNEDGGYVDERTSDEKYKELMQGSPHVKNNTDWTPLMFASRYSNKTENGVKIVKLLLERGANPDLKDNEGWTALMMSARNSNTTSNIETVRLLLEYKSDVNLKENEGWTALMMSARVSNIESNIQTVKLLLEYGTKPNIKSINGWTALILSARNSNTESNIETVKLLLEYGADPNIKNNNGWTALILSARNIVTASNIETVKLLLEYGADPFVKVNCENKKCEKLIAEYRWKRLYERDKDTSKRYAKQTIIPKEIWELILLEKRRQLLCSNLSTSKNREILFLFALEFNIPVTEDMTKAQICGMISRYLAYGKHPKPLQKGEKDVTDLKNKLREVAYKFGINPDESPEELLRKLAEVLRF